MKRKFVASKAASAAAPLTLLAGLAVGESPRWHEDRPWFAKKNR